MRRVLVCAAVLACGQRTFIADDTIDDSGAPKDSTTSSDTSTGTDTGTTATSFGAVFISSWDYTVGTTPAKGHSASASFYATTPSSPCTTEKLGACTYYECPSGPSDAGTPTGTSAGVITITGGIAPLTLTPTGGTYNVISNTTAPHFSGGESLSVSAAGSGSGVPAFDLSITAPSNLMLTSPSMTGLTIQRSSNLTVTWTGTVGTANVAVSEYITSTSRSVQCQFPASAGTGTIPSSTLMKLGPGTGSFGLSNQSSATTTKGIWGVYFYATSLCKSTTGSATGTATIQ